MVVLIFNVVGDVWEVFLNSFGKFGVIAIRGVVSKLFAEEQQIAENLSARSERIKNLLELRQGVSGFRIGKVTVFYAFVYELDKFLFDLYGQFDVAGSEKGIPFFLFTPAHKRPEGDSYLFGYLVYHFAFDKVELLSEFTSFGFMCHIIPLNIVLYF